MSIIGVAEEAAASLVPGGGIMLRIGRLFKAIPWPVYAALAFIGLAWLWGNHRAGQGYDHGVVHERHLWQPTLRALRTAQANVVTLRSSVDQQNAAVLAAKAATDKAQAATHEALGRVLSADKAAAGLRDRAARLARSTAPCVSPDGDALSKSAWGNL